MATTTKKTTGKTSGNTRKLSAEEYRVLAEHAKEQERGNAKTTRLNTAKRAVGVPQRQWVTDKQAATAAKQEHQQHSATKAQRAAARRTGDQRWRSQRDGQIRHRNRMRRRPWWAACAATGLGLAGQGVVTLLSTTTSADPRIVAASAAAAPVVVGAGIAASGEKRYQRRLSHAQQHAEPVAPTAPAHRRMLPEFLVATAASGGLVYWLATSGPSWLAALLVLVVTSILGIRWWRAHPIGPRTPQLNPQQATEQTEETPETPVASVDEYARAWRRLKLGSLTNRTDGHNTVDYDVDGASHKDLSTNIDAIAAALGIDTQQVIPKPPAKDAQGWRPANRAKLSIITHDAVAGQRYWNGPHVTVKPDNTAAVITNLARFRDGQGEASLTMWNKDGMVPTAVFGGTGGGKSAGMNALAVAALSTQLMNSVYVDFKGNSSGALRSRARIVVVGRDAVTDVKKLMKLLTDVRIKNDPRDKQFPSAERPGWLVMLDEITKGIKGDPTFAQEMEHMATTVRSLGIWPVASSQDMHSSAWGNTNTRAAFAKQAVSFYMNTSSDQLINGMTYKPSSLPTYDEDEADIGQEEQPVPGFAVHVNAYRANIPCRWDWLPADDDPVDDEPPYRVSSAFDEFVREPGIAPDEYAALVTALGPPNDDGRWIIGTGGTHKFPTENTAPSGNARPVRTSRNFAKGTSSDDTAGEGSNEPDDPVEREILRLVAGGTQRTGDIKEACSASRSSAERALTDLTADGRIVRTGKGVYAMPETAPATV